MSKEIKETNDILILDNATPEDVAKAMIDSGHQKEPFYVFDMDEAYRRIQHFKEMMPRVQMFYAVKSSDNDRLLKLAATLGLGFDCSSPAEIANILKLNVSPLSIIFATPTKSSYWMTFARESGIRYTTVDSSCELNAIKQYWPEARLLLRIKVDGDSKNNSVQKFGCNADTDAIDLLEEAAALCLKVVGISFHVGCPCFTPDSYKNGLRKAKALFDHEAQAGRGMSIVNIGGGFLGDQTDSIDEASKIINSALEEFFPDPNIQVMAEPGRYICESSYDLYCSINSVRRIKTESEEVNMIYMNDGVLGCLRTIEPWHTVKRFESRRDIIADKPEKTLLWGPSCDPRDQVMANANISLPRCTTSDWLVFPKQGSYSYVRSTMFSSIQKTLIRSVITRKLWDQIKNNKVFDPEEFIEDLDISSPLPSTLPTIVKPANILPSNYTLKA